MSIQHSGFSVQLSLPVAEFLKNPEASKDDNDPSHILLRTFQELAAPPSQELSGRNIHTVDLKTAERLTRFF